MTLGIPAYQLAYMRAQIAQLLPDTCVLLKPTYTPDGAGGNTLTYAPFAGGTVACRLDPVTQKRFLETYAEREGLIDFYQLTLPYDAPLQLDQRVSHGSFTYEVRGLHDDNDWPVSKRATLARLD